VSHEVIVYRDLLAEIKVRVRKAQHRAIQSANSEMIWMYWDIGRMIAFRKDKAGWGAGVIRKLSIDLKNELPEEKGFSETNLKRMVQFHEEYAALFPIGAQPVPQLLEDPAIPKKTQSKSIGVQPVPQFNIEDSIGKSAFSQLSWGHHILLIQKVKDLPTRMWYARQTIEQGWSRDVLTAQIKSQAHQRQGAAITNFGDKLPAMHAQLATSRFAVVATKSPHVLATKWRQVVATGASPWFVPQPRFSVPKGRHERVLEQGSCRPFGTHRRGVVWSTGSRPWLQPTVPLGLNRIHSKPKACSAVPCTEAHQ